MCEMMVSWILFAVTLWAHATGEPSKCEKLASLATWKDHNTVVETNLRTLTGTWISEGCETRPGPEYVLRSYTFNQDGTYHLMQHHYWDDSCSSPKVSVLAYGRIQLRNSAIQPGASNGVASNTNITVIPQDSKAADELNKLVAMECPGQYWKSWKRNEEHTVFDSKHDRKAMFNLWSQSYQPIGNHHALLNHPRNAHRASGNINCLGSLKWAFSELKLVKVQLRPTFDNTRKRAGTVKQVEMELLLGDIHSNKRRREFYPPTSFQPSPLLKQTRHASETITLNKQQYSIIKSPSAVPINLVTNSKAPPHLIEKPHLPPYIWGEWTSTRCEVRPQGVYLLRKFSFNEDDSTWVGNHKFFADPFCSFTKFIVIAAGGFSLAGQSEEIKGSTNIDLEIESATLTALDSNVITDMRLPGFCGFGEWKPNVPKDLGPTNGCIHLGIQVPSIRYDVIKVDMDYKGSWLLFMGQADTDNLQTGPNDRPTAFQLPMVKCGDIPSYSQSLQGLFERRYYLNSASFVTVLPLHFILLLYFILLKC